MAQAADLALYVGEGGNVLSDGTPLIPGVTVCQVPQAEAEASDLWRPTAKGKTDSKNPRNAPPPEPEAA